MGFTQEKKIEAIQNNFCQGCDEHCVFGVHTYYTGFEWVCPSIGCEPIKEYVDENGEKQLAVEQRGAVSYNDVIEHARKIATLCDKYKTRQSKLSGLADFVCATGRNI